MAVEKYVDSRGRVSYRIRGAKLLYPNFAGTGGQFNDEGNRNFNIELTQDEFDFLTDEGFRPRMREKIDADPQLLLKVNVKFKDDPADTSVCGPNTRRPWRRVRRSTSARLIFWTGPTSRMSICRSPHTAVRCLITAPHICRCSSQPSMRIHSRTSSMTMTNRIRPSTP